MAARRIDGSWYVDFYFRRARIRVRAPLNTRAGAEQYERALRAELTEHGNLERLDPRRQKAERAEMPTFAAFAERWMRDYVLGTNMATSQAEKRHVLNGHLVPFFGKSRLPEIDALAVDQYKAAKRAAGLSPKTVNNHLTILRKALDSACDWKLLNMLPRIKFLPTDEPPFKFLTPAEADTLIAATPDGLWRAMITTALRTGMRFSELVALEWGAVDWNTGTHGQVTVRAKNVRGQIGAPKTRRIRHIPLTGDAAAQLQALRTGSSAPNDLVFSFEGRWVRHSTALLHIEEACRRANVPHVRWHDLRHSFASHLVMAGVPIRVVQDLMGHSTIEMTMRYSHLAPSTLNAAVAVLESQLIGWAAGGQKTHESASVTLPAFALQGSNLLSRQPKAPALASAS